MPMLDPPARERLIRVLRLLSSDRLGERASAGAMANRIVQSAELDWTDVIVPACVPYVPPPETNYEAERHRKAERDRIAARSWAKGLSTEEIDVLIASAAWEEPTPHQAAVLERIIRKIQTSSANGWQD